MYLKRQLSTLLAAVMVMSSANITLANDKAAMAKEQSDDVVSGSAVITNDEHTEPTGDVAEISMGNKVTPMADEDIVAYPVEGGNIYIDSSGRVVDADAGVISANIPREVDGIIVKSLDYAFWENTSIRHVVLPDTMTGIYEQAFYGCESLEDIYIPNSVTKIEDGAFWNCKSLKEIIIPDNVTEIESDTFYGCSSLKKIVIGEKMKYISPFAFEGCTSIETIEVSSNNEALFSDEGVLFSDEGELILYPPKKDDEEYTIPYPVNIDINAFANCANLKKLTIPEGRIIYRYAFKNSTSIESIVIDGNIEQIQEGAFSGCTNLKSITISGLIKNIDSNAFKNSTSIESIVIDGNTEQIPEGAFSGCTNLKSITISGLIKNIDSNAFENCYGLEDVYFNGTEKQWNEIEINTDGNESLFSAKIHFSGIPAERIFQYKLNEGTIYFNEGTSAVTGFSGFENTSLVIPEKINDIEVKAISGSGNTIDLTLPNTVTYIADNAFGNKNIKSINLSDSSITYIGKSAFAHCSLTNIDLPDCLTYIGDYAFSSSDLTSIKIPNGVTSIGEHTFWCCYDLTNVELPNSITTIGDAAFAVCESLKTINLPDSLIYIGKRAFSSCHSLSGVYLPSSIKTFQPNIFNQCINLILICEENSQAQKYAIESEYPYVLKKGDGLSDLSDPPEVGQLVDQGNNRNKTWNINSYFDGTKVDSNLYYYDNNIVRVEGYGGYVYIEFFDAKTYECISSYKIQYELPKFGGFYSGKEFNYLVYGQDNPECKNNVEVLRVVKYTKDWKRLSSAKLFGCNTETIFYAGSLRMAENDEYLYIRTSHRMYPSTDGLKHQENMTIFFDPEKNIFKRVDDGVDSTPVSGYTSHSFNQFIDIDKNGSLATVDLGDASPARGVIFFDYSRKREYKFGDMTLTGIYMNVLLKIYGNHGDNYTGVNVGSFKISENNYLVAGNTVEQNENFYNNKTYKVFLSVLPKDSNEAKNIFFDYKDYSKDKDYAGSRLYPPFLTDIGNNRFMLIWSETEIKSIGENGEISRNDSVFYVVVDENGNKLSDIYEKNNVSLSDCPPLVHDNKLIWYVTDSSLPIFYSIDLNDYSKINEENGLIAVLAEGGNIYIDKDGYVVKCDENVVSAKIPEKANGINVKGIKDNAFAGCKVLNSLTIPESVAEIPEDTFKDCVSLKEINCTKGSFADNKNLYPEDTEIKYVDEQTYLYGDADINGVLTAADASMVLQKVLDSSFKMSVEDTKEDYMYIADVDRNDILTAADASMILQKVLDSSFQMTCESQ